MLSTLEKVQLEVLGLFSSQPQEATFTLLLGEVGGYRRLPIMIGIPEAQAIALAIEGSQLDRPIMHDLFKDVLTKVGYTIQEVIITTLQDGIFFARIIMTDGTVAVELDARPSDAIAIGLRFEAPLFIDKALLNETGGLLVAKTQLTDIKADLSMLQTYAQQQSDTRTNFQHYSVEALKKMLSAVIAQEDYEQAALIRDELKRRSE